MWVVLLPGAAHMSRIVWLGLGSNSNDASMEGRFCSIPMLGRGDREGQPEGVDVTKIAKPLKQLFC
jgi:hypothetical protein